jgi:hypothetical protein
MQTTLRIDDELYRKAKAEAARQGITLTRFIEEGLRLRLRYHVPPDPSEKPELPTFEGSGRGFAFSPDALKALMRQLEQAHDLRKLTQE